MLATLRQRDFALLWLAGLVSTAGDFALVVALPLHAYALTGSAAATGGVFAASLLPRVLFGSMAGVFVDRWDRRRTLVAADLLRAVLLLPLLAVVSPDLLWLLYLVRAAIGMLGLLFNPAEAALLPHLVGEERLVTANALNALNNNLGRLIGPAIGGVLYGTGGLHAVVLADAASFIISALLILAIRTRPRRAPSTSADGASRFGRVFAEWWAGLALVGRNSALRITFLASTIGAVGEGTIGAGFAPFVVDVLQGGAGGAGLLMSAQAVGGLVAGVLVARLATRTSPRALFVGGLIGLGVADLGFANAARFAPPGPPAVALAALFMGLAGIPVVAGNAAGTGLLQALTQDAYRGRVFAALGTSEGLSTLIGLAFASVAIDSLGVVPVLSIGAMMWIVGGVYALLRLPPETGVTTAAPRVAGDRQEPAA